MERATNPPGLGATRISATETFASLLASGQTIVLPGVVNGLTARLAERSGFSACYLTGAGLANMEFGFPDVGLVTLTEMIDQARRVIDATTLPVVVDADTGFGGVLSVMRTVHLLEQAGAAAVQLEDQVLPKRCGHFDGKKVVDTGEMVVRIRAALRARQDPALLIVARTDARAVEGFDAAITRARAYREAGADVLFFEAPESEEEIERVPQELAGVPLIANVVEGGRTPELSTSRLADLGYQIVLYANLVSRVMAKAGQQALLRLREDGDTRASSDAMLSWPERQSLVMLPMVEAIEDDLLNGAASTRSDRQATQGTERSQGP